MELWELIVFSVLYVVLALPVSIVIHEAGHFIFGSFSGYRLSAFCVFGLALVVDSDDKLSFRRETHMSIGGYCIMTTERKDGNPYPLILGGCILNLLLGIALLFMAALFNSHPLFLFVLASMSISVGVASLFIPQGSSDGNTLLEVKKDGRELYNAVMTVHRMIIEGRTFSQVPDRLMSHKEKCTTSLALELDLYRYYGKLEKREFDTELLSRICRKYNEIFDASTEKAIAEALEDKQLPGDVSFVSNTVLYDAREVLKQALLLKKRDGAIPEELKKRIEKNAANSVYRGEWRSVDLLINKRIQI